MLSVSLGARLRKILTDEFFGYAFPSETLASFKAKPDHLSIAIPFAL